MSKATQTPQTDEKPTVEPNDEAVQLIRAANVEIADARNNTDRRLVGKLAALMTRKGKSRLTVEVVEASLKVALEGKGGNLIGWQPTYARHILTVHEMMNSANSSRHTIKDLFTLAADLHANAPKKDAEGGTLTKIERTAAVRNAIRAVVDTERETPEDLPVIVEIVDGQEIERPADAIETLRMNTPKRAKSRSAHHKGSKVEESLAPWVALTQAVEAMREAFAAHGMTENYQNAVQDALAELNCLAVEEAAAA